MVVILLQQNQSIRRHELLFSGEKMIQISPLTVQLPSQHSLKVNFEDHLDGRPEHAKQSYNSHSLSLFA